MVIDKIKEARKRRGIRQKHLANMVGVSQGTISNIESGRRQASIRLVEKIFTALGYKLITVPKEEL